MVDVGCNFQGKVKNVIKPLDSRPSNNHRGGDDWDWSEDDLRISDQQGHWSRRPPSL